MPSNQMVKMGSGSALSSSQYSSCASARDILLASNALTLLTWISCSACGQNSAIAHLRRFSDRESTTNAAYCIACEIGNLCADLRRSPVNRENEVDIPQGLCDNTVDRRPRIIILSTKRHEDGADRPYLCDGTKRNLLSRLTGGASAQVMFAPGIGRSGIGGPAQSLREYGSLVRSSSAGIRNRKRRTSPQIDLPSTYQSRY
jgi:hypothetical protein